LFTSHFNFMAIQLPADVHHQSDRIVSAVSREDKNDFIGRPTGI